MCAPCRQRHQFNHVLSKHPVLYRQRGRLHRTMLRTWLNMRQPVLCKHVPDLQTHDRYRHRIVDDVSVRLHRVFVRDSQVHFVILRLSILVGRSVLRLWFKLRPQHARCRHLRRHILGQLRQLHLSGHEHPGDASRLRMHCSRPDSLHCGRGRRLLRRRLHVHSCFVHTSHVRLGHCEFDFTYNTDRLGHHGHTKDTRAFNRGQGGYRRWCDCCRCCCPRRIDLVLYSAPAQHEAPRRQSTGARASQRTAGRSPPKRYHLGRRAQTVCCK